MTVGLVGWVIVFHYRIYSLVTKAVSNDGLICKYCSYDLRATMNLRAASDALCTECGKAFDHEALRSYWHKHARGYKLKRRQKSSS